MVTNHATDVGNFPGHLGDSQPCHWFVWGHVDIITLMFLKYWSVNGNYNYCIIWVCNARTHRLFKWMRDWFQIQRKTTSLNRIDLCSILAKSKHNWESVYALFNQPLHLAELTKETMVRPHSKKEWKVSKVQKAILWLMSSPRIQYAFVYHSQWLTLW